MSYVSKTLISGEQIVATGKFHWTYTLGSWTLVIVGIIGSIPLAGIPLILTLIGALYLVRKWTTEIVVTNRRLIFKKGWIARKTEEMSLNRIEELNLVQGVLGRVLSYGKLVCNGTGASDIKLPTIASPLAFRKVVQEAQYRYETSVRR